MNKEELTKLITDKLVGSKKRAAIAALKNLELTNGRLTTRLVVNAAKPATSPLHSFFEWNNSIAAEKFRLTQAALLIRTVKVIVTMPDLTPREIRAYVAPARGFGYVTIVNAMSQKEMREQLLAQAKLDLEAFHRRYEMLHELAEVFDAIQSMVKKMKPAKKKKRRAA
jgi:hypothetical protein